MRFTLAFTLTMGDLEGSNKGHTCFCWTVFLFAGLYKISIKLLSNMERICHNIGFYP